MEKGFHEHVRQRDDGGEAMLKTPRVGEEVGEATLPMEAGVSTVGPWVAEAKMAGLSNQRPQRQRAIV